MKEETIRQLRFLASMPAGSVTMKDADVETMLLESGSGMLARGSLYNYVIKPIGAGVSRVALELANPTPRAKVTAPPVENDPADQAVIAAEYFVLHVGEYVGARDVRLMRKAFIAGWKARVPT